MILRAVVTILILGLAAGGFYGWKTHRVEQKARLVGDYKAPPVTVSTATAGTAKWQRVVRATGTMQAENSVTLGVRAAGILTEVRFRSAQQVKAGDVLAKIDDTTERAQLKSAEAALGLAESNLSRKKKLLKNKMISMEDIDELEEQVAVGKAELERIQDLIDHKLLKAPFDGTLGLRNIEVGAYMPVGSAVVDLRSSEKMLLRFFIPERHLSLLEVGRQVDFKLDTYPEMVFQATIVALDSTLAENNRSLEVEAKVDNPDGRLIPGMFSIVSIPVGETEPTVVAPLAALVFSLYGDAVYVVTDEQGGKVAKRRQVKVGRQKNGQIQILEGLKDGELVVVAGQGKLREGVKVKIDNSNLPIHPTS